MITGTGGEPWQVTRSVGKLGGLEDAVASFPA